MKTFIDHLSSYAAYHRDRRNVATHFIGIPPIVVAVMGALSRPSIAAFGLPISPAVVLAAGAVAFYVGLDRRYGAVMGLLTVAAMGLGALLAALPTSEWLAACAGLFVGGWIAQLVGHVFEGRKPAFVDDIVGLLVGPIFLLAEVAFALGLSPELRAEVERRAGPMRVGRVVDSKAQGCA